MKGLKVLLAVAPTLPAPSPALSSAPGRSLVTHAMPGLSVPIGQRCPIIMHHRPLLLLPPSNPLPVLLVGP